MKFGQLILRKIIKITATRCQILRLKCTKFDFHWGSAPDPAGGAYSAHPDTLAGIKGPLRGREGTGKDGEREGKYRWRGRGRGQEEGRERKGKDGGGKGKGNRGNRRDGTGQDMGWDG